MIGRLGEDDAYRALRARVEQRLSQAGYYARSAYSTSPVQPGSSERAGLKRLDIFNHDIVVAGPELAYEGWQYGWGVIPDQYAWGLFRDRWFARPPEPYYVYYMSVSTHCPWNAVHGTPLEHRTY